MRFAAALAVGWERAVGGPLGADGEPVEAPSAAGTGGGLRGVAWVGPPPPRQSPRDAPRHPFRHCPTETFHNLVAEYRKAKKMYLNYEHRLMLQMTGDYDNLTLMQKVEVFEYALENTDGQDLNKVLWLRSPSSQVCLPLPPRSGPSQRDDRDTPLSQSRCAGGPVFSAKQKGQTPGLRSTCTSTVRRAVSICGRRPANRRRLTINRRPLTAILPPKISGGLRLDKKCRSQRTSLETKRRTANHHDQGAGHFMLKKKTRTSGGKTIRTLQRALGPPGAQLRTEARADTGGA